MFAKYILSNLNMISNRNTLSTICIVCMICNMTSFAVFAVFEACTTVWCPLLHGSAIFLIASDGLTKSLEEFGLWICGIYFWYCLSCCTIFWRRRLRSIIAHISLIQSLIPQTRWLESFSCLLIGICCFADAIRRRTRLTFKTYKVWVWGIDFLFILTYRIEITYYT